MKALRFLTGITLLALLACLSAGARDEKEKESSDEDGEALDGNVLPVLNVGGHSSMITGLVFNKTGDRLYTVARELMEWDVESGELLRTWRFPQGAHRIALSPDGKQLAVGCHSRLRAKDGKRHSSVWLLNLLSGEGQVVGTLVGGFVRRVAFSPRGDRIAASAGSATGIFSLDGKGAPELVPGPGRMLSLAFDPSGKRLLTAQAGTNKTRPMIRIHDIGSRAGEKTVALVPGGEIEPMAAWSPSGKRVAGLTGGRSPSFTVWTVGKKGKEPDWSLDHQELVRQLGNEVKTNDFWSPLDLVFRSENEVLACWEQFGWVRIVLIDLAARKARLLPSKIGRQNHYIGMALSQGRWLAMSSNPSYRIAIYDLKEGKSRVYRDPETGKDGDVFGSPIRRPSMVGWTREGNGILWGYLPPPRAKEEGKSRKDVLQHGLNLATQKLIPGPECEEAARPDLPTGWEVKATPTEATLRRPKRANVTIALPEVRASLVRSFKDSAGKLRLLVPHQTARAAGYKVALVDPDTGTVVDHIKGQFFPVYDLAVSPDDRYLLLAAGHQSMVIFDLANHAQPLLRVLYNKGDWIALTPKGYYAGTPGGEQLMGWHVQTDPERLAAFYPAQAFHKKLYKPDVISHLLAEGSVEKALKKTAAAALTNVEEMLPPRVRIVSAEKDPKDAQKWIVKAEAESASPGQPVQGLRLMIGSRPLPESDLAPRIALKAKPIQAEWTVPNALLPAGDLELKVLARCKDVVGLSAPHKVVVQAAVADRPALHVVSIGLNYDNDPNLKLRCAKNDAEALARGLVAGCVGEKNYFGRASKPHLLLNDQASAGKIKEAIREIRKAGVKPNDLLVVFYAGHGVREKEQFYLFTHGARVNNLAKTALSGEDLRGLLADFPCQVLLLLDACHSGNAGKALRGLEPATDDASRELADEECRVALLAAALGNEKALEPRAGEQNGLFTQAVLKALGRAGASTADREASYNHQDGRQYIHHLFVDVLDQVQAESEDRQHPFLCMHWTVTSFPVRKVK
jgi:WD40 repeat protein